MRLWTLNRCSNGIRLLGILGVGMYPERGRDMILGGQRGDCAGQVTLRRLLVFTLSIITSFECPIALWVCVCKVTSIPMDCSPPGSPVHEILQARTLEWVAMPVSRGSCWPRDWTCVSCSSCIAGRFLSTAPPGKPLLWPCYQPITYGKGGGCIACMWWYDYVISNYLKALFVFFPCLLWGSKQPRWGSPTW